jgi:hypothetical protein
LKKENEDISNYELEKRAYLHWWNNIDSMFGVVKVDHVGNYGYANRLSYQMINSLNLTYEDVKDIVSDEIRYVKMLKNNWDGANSKNLSKKDKEIMKQRKEDMTYFMNYIGNIDFDDSVDTTDMIKALLSVNTNFRFTQKFKDWKKHQINDYVNNLRMGKIRISNSIYAILFSCPYNMLLQTTKDKQISEEENIYSGWEIYNPRYKNGEYLCMIRNPQINGGNIAHVKNTYHEEHKWFNLSDFVVIVNSYDCDIMNRLQGCDFDIDSALLINQPKIVQKAKECMESYLTPINNVKGKVELRKDNMTEFANLDNYLGTSTRTIGQIVNKSAICNAYMWDTINNKGDDRYINKYYDASSMLSSFSQIAIDMAKKSFINPNGKRLSLLDEMQKINSWDVDENSILKFEENKITEELIDKTTGEVTLKKRQKRK